MNTEKIKEVFSDEAFVKSLFELETAAQVQTALKEKGVELSEEEILSLRELLIKVQNGEITQNQLNNWAGQVEGGELSEDALEQIAGGCALTVFGIAAGIVAIIGIGGAEAWIIDSAINEKTGHHW